VERWDITALILDDHDTFRRGFAALDALQGPPDNPDAAAQTAVWRPLADLLDIHAAAEEELFYPRLLRTGDADAVDETVDAIGDHNEIRDGIRQADAAAVGSEAWWAGVNATRAANTEHMGEEEDGGLADFRRRTDPEQRRTLGRAFLEFKATHRVKDVDTTDKDPDAYVAGRLPEHDQSLRIGNLR
jgi:hypothetical protein